MSQAFETLHSTSLSNFSNLVFPKPIGVPFILASLHLLSLNLSKFLLLGLCTDSSLSVRSTAPHLHLAESAESFQFFKTCLKFLPFL